MSKERAREALEAQGVTAAGPKLIELVMDAIARVEEGQPGGVRLHNLDYGALLADTQSSWTEPTGR